MRLYDDSVAMKVPATNANLGPGLDSMGLTLDLWDEVLVHATTGATSVVVEGKGTGNVGQGEDNLVVRVLRLTLGRVSAPQVSVHMHCTNHIPHSRSLGSSVSVIVADVTLAHALIGDADVLGHREVPTIGSQIEGHPDNMVPIVFGSATASWMNDETSEVGSVRLTSPEGINPVTFVPDLELRTAAACVALPATVSHDDASFNVARDTLLAAVPSGNAQAGGGVNLHALLMKTTRDRLRQEQHRAAMEPSLALVDWLRDTGFAAVVFDTNLMVLSLESVGTDIRRGAVAAERRAAPVGVAPQDIQTTCGSLSKVESWAFTRCEFLHKYRQSCRSTDGGLTVLLYFSQVETNVRP